MICAKRVLVTAMIWSPTGRVMSRSSKRLEDLAEVEERVEVGEDREEEAVAVAQG